MESSKPRKQRYFRFNAAMHLRQHFVHAHVDKELRARLGTARRSAPVRKGDKVLLMRGSRKGHSGKVVEVDLHILKVYVEGVTHRNAKGIDKPYPLDPSNLLLLEGEFMKDRLAMIQRSPKAGQKKQ